ncbi:hypothetical protein T484DRAFT_2609792 [Baffinella frigidus]|nr:hypothetical protein T484DRAFT_2609792 [Cryptophyta sp. CCMP2293]
MMHVALDQSSGKLVFQKDQSKPGVDGIKLLMAILKEVCPTYLPLKSLCFWRTMVGDKGLEYICDNLLTKKKNEALAYPGFLNIELFDVKITPIGCAALAGKLSMDVSLQSLVLDFNEIGDAGVQILAKGMKKNTELKVLSLGYCKIGPAGAAAIGDDIIRSSKVTRLRLKGNRIMAAGLNALSRNIGKSESLLELDISDNSITGDPLAINSLCEALRTSISIQEVNLEHNVIENDAATTIMDTLIGCPSIRLFKLCGQEVTSAVYKVAPAPFWGCKVLPAPDLRD